MYKYIIKRLGMVILVVLAVSFAVFFIMDMVPGDPAVTALGDEATAEALAYYRETHGLNDPLIVQYVRYMSGILRRDLGTSIYNGADVWQLYFSKLPYTINLACCSALLAVLCSIPLGMAAAIKRNTWIDAIASMIAFVGLAMPNFWIGILLILAFSVNMSIFPSFGAGDGLRSLVLHHLRHSYDGGDHQNDPLCDAGCDQPGLSADSALEGASGKGGHGPPCPEKCTDPHRHHGRDPDRWADRRLRGHGAGVFLAGSRELYCGFHFEK